VERKARSSGMIVSSKESQREYIYGNVLAFDFFLFLFRGSKTWNYKRKFPCIPSLFIVV
jgi:hypothetical protein